MLHTDALVSAYVGRGQEGWRDYLVTNLRCVFSATKQGQEDYLRHIAPTIVWAIKSKEIKDQTLKKVLSIESPTLKPPCGLDLAFIGRKT